MTAEASRVSATHGPKCRRDGSRILRWLSSPAMTTRAPVAVVALCAASLLGCPSGEAPEGDPENTTKSSVHDPAASGGPTTSDLDREARAQLEALGYVNEVPASEESADRSGVTRNDRSQPYDGLNLFNFRNESAARLMDMEGRVVHRWSSDEVGATYRELERKLPGLMPPYVRGWNHVELLPEGELLVIGSHHMLLRLDRDSKVRWKLDLPAHHDVTVGQDGRIHVLVDAPRLAEVEGEPVAFNDNAIVSVTPEGEVLGEISIFDAIAEPASQQQLARALARIPGMRDLLLLLYTEGAERGGVAERERLRLYREAAGGDFAPDSGIKNVLFHNRPHDILHSNSVQVLDRDAPGLWREGDFLVSVLKLDRVIAIDHRTGRAVWSWGEGELSRAHHATWLGNGNVLIFDNGVKFGRSRILEVDPRSREIVWQYRATPPGSFFSGARGGAQKLPNGNVLVADTDSGRAFELTRGGDIVWEFYSDFLPEPSTGGDGSLERSALYRFTRIEQQAARAFLPTLADSPPGT
jgi:hypothetical protein